MKEKIKVGIAGLGLIGASLLKKLSENDDYELNCASISSFKKALSFCRFASENLEILKNCEIVFVCASIEKTPEILERLNEILTEKTVVADVSSVKSKLLPKKNYNFDFILSHPMAGSHKSGFDAAFAELFSGAKWLIEKKHPLLEKIIKDTGATPFVFDMAHHDEFCAQISHLPAILSFLLFDLAKNPAKQIASSGFRDATRLAMTNSELLLSMFNNNLENIEKTFESLKEKFYSLKNLSDDEKMKLFGEIAQKRAEMYDNCGKNIFKI